ERVRGHRDLLRDHDARNSRQHEEREAGETHRGIQGGAEEQRHEPRREDHAHQRRHRAAPPSANFRSASRASASACKPTATAASGTIAYTAANVKNSATVSMSRLRRVICRPYQPSTVQNASLASAPTSAKAAAPRGPNQ